MTPKKLGYLHRRPRKLSDEIILRLCLKDSSIKRTAYLLRQAVPHFQKKTHIEVPYECGQPRIELGWGKPFCPYHFGPHGWK